jgi:hypothetical protein
MVAVQTQILRTRLIERVRYLGSSNVQAMVGEEGV